MTLSVLHISDLHRDPGNPIRNQVLLDSLERDRDRYTSKENPRIPSPNLVIVSGDIIQGVKDGTPDAEENLQRQYDEALAFLNSLTDRFAGGDKRNVIIVPGNHDVSNHHFHQSLAPIDIALGTKKELVAQLFSPSSPLRWSWAEFALYEIVDLAMYERRFAAFADFYCRFYDGARSYTTDPAKQLDIFDYPDLGITFAGFCSCYNTDLFNRQGAIHPDCIGEAGTRLRHVSYQDSLRIAVWHHNTEGPPIQLDYMDPDIIQNMIDGGFSLGFHGHQHKPQFLDTRFRHGLDRRITVISAGTLCGGAALRFGRAYNVVELEPEKRTGRLHLREMQNDNLQMPIWGPRSLPPNFTSYFNFDFDPPPEPFIRPNLSTITLMKAQTLYENNEYLEAAEVLSPLVESDQLARRLLLDCLSRLDDRPRIIAAFDSPESASEAIALMDALWSEKRRDRLVELLKTAMIEESTDPSVIEIRKKYTARLRK